MKRPVVACECGEHAFVAVTKGRVALFDVADTEIVARWNWSLVAGRYAARREPQSRGGRTVMMHQAIGGAVDGAEKDHRDGNGMNNRRRNLRPATKAQNQMNRHKVVSRHGFKGVTANKARWSAGTKIRIDGQRTYHHFGTFDTPEEAARAYDHGARQLFGEFARTNFA